MPGFRAGSVVVMEEVRSGKSDHPEADDEGADGENPVASAAITRGQRRGFVGSKNLTAKANGHEDGAEDEGGPSHGFIFLS
jgi:hypothetical protein